MIRENKSYDIDSESQSSMKVADPGVEYGRAAERRTERMSVEEYFSEVRKVLHKKYEDVQS